MSQPAVEVDSLGIFFKAYHKKGLSKKDVFISYGKDLLSSVVRPHGSSTDSDLFWALRNVSFSVDKGEVIGIVGENGSGKSTLLKTISGIFRPDEGRVTVKGKIGALLELGAGFHPELTGRENIYLNGSILGMKKRQIDKIYDEIVSFSELEKFIDTPVKNYSSGMKVKIGFSVAAHLYPDILLVDEVLAVGDLAFRVKCLDKMYEFRRDGVTIIFVSHNLSLVTKFCTKGIFIHEGKLAFMGNVSDCVDHYIYHKYGTAAQSGSKRWGSMEGTIGSIRILNVNGKETAYLKTGDPISIVVEYRNGSGVKDPVMGIAITNEDNSRVYGINTTQSAMKVAWRNEGKIVFTIPTLSLAEGTYLLTVALHDKNPHKIYDWHDKARALEVVTAKEFAGSYDLECRIEGF